MDEVWLRIGLILGALAVAASIALIQRRRARSPVRSVEARGFDPGVYFFSSSACPTCSQARKKLNAALGDKGYIELVWEEEPGVFDDLGVDAVPAVVVVREDGRGKLYPGQPERVLSLL